MSTKPTWKTWVFAGLCLLLILVVLDAKMNAQAENSKPLDGLTFDASEAVTPVLSTAVRDLPTGLEVPQLDKEVNPIEWFGSGVGESGTPNSFDALAANGVSSGETPSVLLTFEGVSSLSGVTPPDTNGDVGPNHYVQMTNFSFRIWNKGDVDNGIAPTPLTAPILLGTFFAPLGNGCQNNYGDPVVMYDDMADRWLLSQFDLSGTLGLCIAISTTPDPTGTYYLYNFSTPAFPDYFKFGVWPDGYYMSTNTGSPNQYWAHVFDRNKMLAGLPATRQGFGGIANFLMPADVDGTTPPPAGSPGIFYTMYDQGYVNHPAGVDRLAIYHLDVDWTTPGNSSLSLAQEIPISAYNYTVCGFFVQNCLAQPGTSQTIDTLSYWPMFRFQYRNFGGSDERMVGNFTVDLNNTNKAAIRWFEVRKNGGTYNLYQEGTYAPDNAHRWMGSIAMDKNGNIALGYSVVSASNPTVIPSVRYATRLTTDPLGTLQGEATMWAGTGVQTGAVRWGDYSNMVVDPVDGCHFWFTTEYHDINDAGFNWNTRIGVFQIPECDSNITPTPTPTGPTPTPTNTPVATNTPTPTMTSTPSGRPTRTPTPTPGAGGTMHIGDLDGSSAPGANGRWNATVVVTVHDGSDAPLVGVLVTGLWSNGTSGSGSCTTNASGQCSIIKNGIRANFSSVVFTVTNATKAGYTYQAASNHDPDGDSNGTTITVQFP
ncbi:MAG: Ig-like domain-containing protein [Anaerolineales bacterium]|nr:Ig-like domain-containing protein [Anaerolineales bacterium]